MVKDRQPGTHAVLHGADIVHVDLVALELADHLRAGAVVVHQTHIGGAKLHVGNVLRHVPADAAVDLLDPAHVPPLGDVLIRGEALNVHKNCADDYDTHAVTSCFLFPLWFVCSVRVDNRKLSVFFTFRWKTKDFI